MADDPRRDAIIAAARARLGVPYRLDPPPDGVNDLDCSLYVLKVFEAAGVPLPPGVRTAEQIRAALVPIAFEDVLPGDALLFEHTYDSGQSSVVGDGHVATHIGISLGAGSRRMLNALEPVSTETNIGTPYWQGHLLSAGRLPQLVDARQQDPGGDPETTTWIEGIDIASYQGRPDWDKVAAAGITFAIIKATEGLGYVNPTFADNWAGAARVGIVRAAYHWGDPSLSAAQQARFFTDTVGPLAPTDFLMLDSEEGDGDIGAWTLDCLRGIEGIVGFKPVDYTGRWFSDPHGFPQHPELAAYPLALAAYQDALPPPPAPWDRVTIWQYSDAGQIPGIVGNVDRDRFLGSMDQLRALGKGGSVAEQGGGLDRWRAVVGSGILDMMAADGTEPLMSSTWLPLGRGQADAEAEQCTGVNGRVYFWHVPSGRSFRYDPAT